MRVGVRACVTSSEKLKSGGVVRRWKSMRRMVNVMTEYVSWISDMELYWILKDEEWVQPSTLHILLGGDVDDRGLSNSGRHLLKR
jgi:hypothetical protein